MKAQRKAFKKHLLCLSLYSLQALAISLVGSPSSAQQGSCKSTISRISNDIEGRLGGKIAYLNYEAGKAENSPTSRKDRVNFQLGVRREGPQLTSRQVQANLNILSSAELMREYASSIIGTCQDVAQVEIGLMWSDAQSVFSFYPNGQIREDECLSSIEHPNLDLRYLRWGVRICS